MSCRHLTLEQRWQIATLHRARSSHKDIADWQRGCNGNSNGLLRQFFPRERDFSTIAKEELKIVEDQLSGRPRKRLSPRTPSELIVNHDHVAIQS